MVMAKPVQPKPMPRRAVAKAGVVAVADDVKVIS